MENVRELLPIGSIVLAKGGVKRMMIFGVKQTQLENEGTPEQREVEYDYLGVPYPEGNMGEEFQYLFNAEDIIEVSFRGYEDAERIEFIKNLEKYLKDGTLPGVE